MLIAMTANSLLQADGISAEPVDTSVSSIKTEITTYKNQQSGLTIWRSTGEGFKIELIQLLPDYIRAIYGSHNIPKTEIEKIANYCVFGTIAENTSQSRVSYRVAEWKYADKKGNIYPVKTKGQWIDEWRKAGVTFSWTLLPESSDFEIGDWQQGFTTVKLAREEKFDFIYTWTKNGKKYRATIENMQCAPANLEHLK